MNDASSDALDDPAAVEAAVAAARTALRSAVAALANGVVREGQDDMCAAVASAFVRREHLLVQAGTGTGKSLAYLVPSVLADGRVVIVTATKALQEQLCSKDLPLLRSTLQRPFEFAALKGRSNYVCLARKQEVDADRAATLAGMRDDDDVLDEVDEWVASTGSGDRADLPVAVSESLWSALSIDSQECPGRAKCAFGETCFAERARDRAAEADVIVVNTALYAQHLDAGGGVLPPHDWVVVDEAHSLEDIAADAFGVALGSTRLGRLASLVRTVLTGDGGGDVGDVADLGGQVAGHEVDAVGQILPGAGDAGHVGLAAEPPFGADLAGDARHLAGEPVELVHHGVERLLELKDLAAHIDRDLARQVAARHGGGHVRDVAHLVREVAGEQVYVVGKVLPRSRNALNFRLATKLSFRSHFARHRCNLLGKDG